MNFIDIAKEEAYAAMKEGEIPVGAVIVKEGRIIAQSHNLKEQLHDPTAHAEILAIKKACEVIGDWRLDGCEMYVTLEPCSMCAGAIINARINKVIYGAKDKEMGAVSSVISMFDLDFCHRPKVVSGIMMEECSDILKRFFKKLR